MSNAKRSSRRDFLKGSTAAVAGTALAGSLGIARSAHAAGPEQIKAALIGCGGRGNGAANDFMRAAQILGDDVKIIAVADAFEGPATRAAEGLRQTFGAKADIPPERVFVGLDAYQKAIDCGVEMVIMATPPGFRPLQYAAAIKAGKHVFMEKPCCTDAPGFRSLMASNKLADEKGLKVGVGLQRHHQSPYLGGVKQIQDGALGDLMFLRCYWNGGDIWMRRRRSGMTEMQYQVNNWYHFCWLSGDNICEQHVHNLDVCNWVMDDHPVEANGMGGCQARNQPTRSQIFDHHFVEFTYKNGVKMYSQCRQQNGTWSDVSEWAHGTKGSSGVPRGGGPKLQARNPYEQEHIDLLKAIRNNDKYNEGWYGATSSMTAVLGRTATYSGQIVRWDDAVAKGPNLFAETLTWEADPPVMPGADGKYPIPIPGIYKAY
jgi:myo-inositol 2-dehydrogenase/D-chiro-inositol 1-dehydrogenase